MQATARLFGQTVGAAVVGMVFAARPEDGATWTLVFAAGAAVLAASVSFTRLAAR
jgi:DHA2 family multidrug resistance protein-like MFS transporter